MDIWLLKESSEEKKEKFRQIREYCKRENRIDDGIEFIFHLWIVQKMLTMI